MKGVSQIDFVLSVGVFLVAVIIVLGFMTDYVIPIQETSDVEVMRSKAIDLLNLIEKENSELSLFTTMYKFNIKVENSNEYLINASHTVGNLNNETVKFNFTLFNLRHGVDPNSVSILDNESNPVPHARNDMLISFLTDIGIYKIKYFTVYFDDDSNFTSTGEEIEGINAINEIVYPIEERKIIQYRKILKMVDYDYQELKNMLGTEFKIELQSYTNFFEIGGTAPERGDISVIERSVIIQGSDRQIEEGKLRLYVW
ncbi:hypothetical protein ACFLQN_02485 [Candidatus Aenigmatarchaeota archaeon]